MCVNVVWFVYVIKFWLIGLVIFIVFWDCYNCDVRDYFGNMVYMKDYFFCCLFFFVIIRDRWGLVGWRGGGGEEE